LDKQLEIDMTELTIKIGDEINYSCGYGRVRANVQNISIAPTAKPNHSIVWLTVKLYADPAKGRKYDSVIKLPADASSLKMFKVEVVA
jgi:hypothetical protein